MSSVQEKSIPKITLHNGKQVSEAAFKATLLMLDHLHKQQFCKVLEFDLYKKAQDSSYSFPPFPLGPSSPGELQRLGFLDAQNNMHEYIEAIVQNAFKEGIFGVIPLNPLTGEALAKDYTWEHLQSLFAK